MGPVLGAPAWAQSAETTPASRSVHTPRNPSATEEVVVTAQRRSEKLRDVPASITAIPQATLIKAGINNTSDIAKMSPGVALPFYGNFLQPAIRGVTSTGANVGESSNVALYVDGIYQPQQIATLFELPDVQQVEVLKGPQGALYGQDATGGAILVNSRAPSFTPQGNASFSYGNYNDVNLRGYVTGPITNELAASLAGGYESRDGFRTQVLTGQQDSGLDSKLLRGKVLYRPNEDVKITLAGYYSDLMTSDQNAGFAYNNNSIGYFLYPNLPRVTNASQFGASPDVFTHIKSWGTNLHAAIDTGYGTINEIASYANNRVTYLTDVDESPVDFAIATTNPLTGEYFINETNFVSRKFGAFSFLAGAFFLTGNDTFHTNGFTLFVPSLPPAPEVTEFALDTYQKLSKTIYAGYGELTYQLLSDVTLTAGGRYTVEKVSGYNNFGGTAVGNSGAVYGYPGNPVSFSKFTPRVTARYALTDDDNIYASYSQGFKSGNINLSGTAAPPNPATTYSLPPVRPERIDAYEIGFKGRVIENVQASIAGFYYNYKDLQLVQYAPPSYVEQNAASATIKGVDFDITWHSTPELTFDIGGSVLSAHYGNDSFASVFEPTAPSLANGFSVNSEPTINLSGKQMIRAPDFSGNASINYEHDFDRGVFGAYVLAYYNSGYPMEVGNLIRQKAYTTLDIDFSFAPAALHGARFVLWGKNLSNSAYLASILQSQYGNGAVYAPPRTFGFRGEYAF